MVKKVHSGKILTKYTPQDEVTRTNFWSCEL